MAGMSCAVDEFVPIYSTLSTLVFVRKVGDADMKDPMAYHNGTVFSTYDQDFDTAPINCASKYNSGMKLVIGLHYNPPDLHLAR